jgi:hypothetical protein
MERLSAQLQAGSLYYITARLLDATKKSPYPLLVGTEDAQRSAEPGQIDEVMLS